MNHIDKKIIDNNANEYHRMYQIATAMISAFELFLFLRGIIVWPFNQIHYFFYMGSYAFLFAFSLFSFILLTVYSNNYEKKKRIIHYLLLPYCICLTLFGVAISLLDIYGKTLYNGSHMVGLPSAYAIVMFCIASISMLNPRDFTIISIISFVGLLIGIYFIDVKVLSSGFIINNCIFEIIILFSSFRINHFIRNETLAKEELHKQTNTDFLTRLYNRRYLDKYILDVYDQNKKYCFVLFDVSHLKEINNKYGHKVGDDCIIFIANHLRSIFGKDVFRYGGDEFAVISFESENQVEDKIKQLKHEIEMPNLDIQIKLVYGIYNNDHFYEPNVVFSMADTILMKRKSEEE
jgi:diguanylate cyclase (GGDEF)-like protein